MSLKNWSTTAASNATVDSITFAENQLPSSLNDSARALMADVRNEVATRDTIASATTCDLGSKDAGALDITGTTTITGFGTVSAGIKKHVRFTGSLTLTHNATSLILPGSANITTAANDTAIVESLGSGNWICLAYTKANGQAVASSGPTFATEQNATGVAVYDFTGIPAGVSEITVHYLNHSTDGTNGYLIQIGDSGGFETSGYVSGAEHQSTYSSSTSGFLVTSSIGASNAVNGHVTLKRMNGTHTWTANGNLDAGNYLMSSAGSKTLSGELTQVRITNSGGSNNIDGGSVNISYK